jgi:hypothetical protein
MNLDFYLAGAAGVATSILLPVMIRAVRHEFNAAAPAGKGRSWLARTALAAWPIVRKYLLLLAFSLLTALLIIAVLGDQVSSLGAAFVAGYAWDSTIQKITQKP